MAHKIVEELKGLNAQDIKSKIEGWRRELFGLRLSVRTSHVKNYAQFPLLRKNIARGLTFLNAIDTTRSPQKSDAK